MESGETGERKLEESHTDHLGISQSPPHIPSFFWKLVQFTFDSFQARVIGVLWRQNFGENSANSTDLNTMGCQISKEWDLRVSFSSMIWREITKTLSWDVQRSNNRNRKGTLTKVKIDWINEGMCLIHSFRKCWEWIRQLEKELIDWNSKET
jgi:hypothetical protein